VLEMGERRGFRGNSTASGTSCVLLILIYIYFYLRCVLVLLKLGVESDWRVVARLRDRPAFQLRPYRSKRPPLKAMPQTRSAKPAATFQLL
jgi:hypothetical protein